MDPDHTNQIVMAGSGTLVNNLVHQQLRAIKQAEYNIRPTQSHNKCTRIWGLNLLLCTIQWFTFHQQLGSHPHETLAKISFNVKPNE